MPAIDTARCLDALRRIRAYRTGVHRPDDMEGRRWVMDRMAEVGLDPAMDGIGEIVSRHDGPRPYLFVGVWSDEEGN